ncbi:hypothetical protein [Terrabacter sp. NPDC080008]|uniref:hypothetical protein n=1 Tax=Terrabacter sp. NPDC080008 TaxID=3155176 RepID=UPI00344E847A
MGRAGLRVGLAVAALLLGGCGGGSSSGAAGPPAAQTNGTRGATGPPSATAFTSPPPRFGAGGDSGSEASYGPQFPLTLRRTGGSAGFDDRIVLEANGRLRVETRAVHGRVCRLEPTLQTQLLSLLATLRLGTGAGAGSAGGAGVGSGGVAGSDVPSGGLTPVDDPESAPITISVTDDRARVVDLSDPSLGEIAGLVSTLVSDVTLSVPAVTRCTTPSGTATVPPPSATLAP